MIMNSLLLVVITLKISHYECSDRTLTKAQLLGSDAWKWDEWCQYQPQTGKCKATITRYYYDTSVEKCLKFIYGGCDANKNNFETALECERHCIGNNYVIDEGVALPSLCYLQPDSGMCMAYFKMYYYDVNTKTCKKFIYGGCGGNYNRFDTISSCMSACHKDD